ncbi:hypothetical protein [Pseudoroseicyclus sp. CXY001]|uniref:DUF7742 family protein n=1 Tax=Pseudoroseicyclus sp. CXY001 TaxID=3242492 RepID=UPI0035710A93
MPGDLDLATRALLAVPPPERAPLAETLLAEAALADRYSKRLGRRHTFGAGTLADAALRRPRAPGPALDAGPYLAALQTLLTAIAARRTHRGG